MSVRQRVLEHRRLRLADDPPPLRLIFAEGDCFDFATRPTVIVTLHSAALPRMLLRGNIGRLCDAYVAGELTVEAPIEEVVRTGIALAERIGRFPGVKWLSRFGGRAARGHSRRQAAADVSYHYDVSNEFYRLWLDENMIYSCAYFRSGSEDIDAAQRQKLDH